MPRALIETIQIRFPGKSGLGAGKGNRTLIASLEGWSFTIKLCPRFAEKT
jgi:hypothetical protein